MMLPGVDVSPLTRQGDSPPLTKREELWQKRWARDARAGRAGEDSYVDLYGKGSDDGGWDDRRQWLQTHGERFARSPFEPHKDAYCGNCYDKTGVQVPVYNLLPFDLPCEYRTGRRKAWCSYCAPKIILFEALREMLSGDLDGRVYVDI